MNHLNKFINPKSKKELHIVQEITKLIKEQKELKRIIKDTHVEIEGLENEYNKFIKTPFYLLWKISYIIKHHKFPQQ